LRVRAATLTLVALASTAPALCEPVTTPAADSALLEYGALPSFEDLQVSPDGTKLAYAGTIGDQRHVLVKDLTDGHKVAEFTLRPDQKLRDLQWADETHVLAILTMTTTSIWRTSWGEYAGVICMDLDTGKAWDVLEFPGGTANNATRVNLASGNVRVRRVGGQTWLYLGGYFQTDIMDDVGATLMRVNLANHAHSLIETRDGGGQYGGLIDEQGSLATSAGYDQRRQRWKLKLNIAGHFKPIMETSAGIDVPSVEGFGPDGTSIWVRSWEGGRAHWLAFSRADGHPLAEGFLPAGMHADDWYGALVDNRNNRILGGYIVEPFGVRYEFIDPQLAQRWSVVCRLLESSNVRRVSDTNDLHRVIAEVSAPQGPAYVLIDTVAEKMVLLGPRYRHLPAVGEVRAIEYPAGDGLRIPAYLTLPAHRAASHLPLVVLPHGGPEARDTGEFDWWAQALANAGYAVLQPNYRGSTLSQSFLKAGYGEWGRRMQTDLSDGVHYLAEQGLIDPQRVCIVGASYGGYAALAGVSLQQGIYRCAASYGGVSDLHRIIQTQPGVDAEDNFRARYIERWLGINDANDPAVDARSPLSHAADIHVPVLLVHGHDDTVVRIEHSQRMASALQDLHRDYQYVELKGEDHWLSYGRTRTELLQAVVGFLQRYNPPDPEPGVATH
jgi:dipeptidyl aminopeptidase/acylaminoacyl peptidase